MSTEWDYSAKCHYLLRNHSRSPALGPAVQSISIAVGSGVSGLNVNEEHRKHAMQRNSFNITIQ